MNYDIFEDQIRQKKQVIVKSQSSPFLDLVKYHSSVNPELELSMLVYKPAEPYYALFTTHGWHMSMSKYEPMPKPLENMPYLFVQVDMRGRAYSEGEADLNGLELMDVYDAVQVVTANYSDYLINTKTIYFEAASGGGGNAFAIAGKFPDLFAGISALCGISDYASWYEEDRIGEFRDEMDLWVGVSPAENREAYAARSGMTCVQNLLSPIYIAHGQTDERVPVSQSRRYVSAALDCGKEDLIMFDELSGVGTKKHWGNASEEQMKMIQYGSELNRKRNRKPVQLPVSGELVVCGYVATRHFIVLLEDMGKVCQIRYDLQKREIDFMVHPDCAYQMMWF